MCIWAMPAYAWETVDVYVNGEYLVTDQPATLYNDRTLVPARAVSEAFNALVDRDESNQQVFITMEFDYIDAYRDGLAEVEKGEKYGFINGARQIAMPVIYDYVDWFNEDYAAVELDGKWGFVDKTGKVIIPIIYDYVEAFADGKCYVEVDGYYNYIDKDGNVIE